MSEDIKRGSGNPSLSTEEAKQTVSEVAKFPRVTEEGIKSKINSVDYLYIGVKTICVIEMKNGFVVVGLSAPADERNYNKEVGDRYAYDNAFKQLWQLEGYLLREELCRKGENYATQEGKQPEGH